MCVLISILLWFAFLYHKMSGDVIPGLKNINLLRYLAYIKILFIFIFQKDCQ